MEIKQNTLFLTTPGVYLSRDHLTLKVEIDRVVKLAIPIHHLESVCIFGPQITVSPFALELCWQHGVGVNYFSENGYFIGRWEGVANTSVGLRRAQYRMADDPKKCATIARQCIAGKIQNGRQSLLRSARENGDAQEAERLQGAAEELQKSLRSLENAVTSDSMRGCEGMAASVYFSVFDFHLKQQREEFHFRVRSKRPPLDAVNCLLSYLYALLTHDCIAALTATGLDPFVGFLHVERPNRPSLALDMMEEFRPAITDRLAITLINRRQVAQNDFVCREGGAYEFTPTGRKAVMTAYQTRKQDVITHPLLGLECRIGQLFLMQARIMARHLRGDLPEYMPCLLK